MFKMSSNFENKVLQNLEKSQKQINKNGLPQPSAHQIIEVAAKVVTKVIPKNEVLEFNSCVDYIKRRTNLDTDLISKGLVRAIDRKGVIAADTRHGVYIRKNQL